MRARRRFMPVPRPSRFFPPFPFPLLQFPISRMTFATWITFVIAGSLIAISPGSGAVMAMSHGLAYGIRKASATVLGLQIGLLLVFVIAGAGVGSLLLASELAFGVVKTVGALYLIWCGVSQWRARAAAGARSKRPRRPRIRRSAAAC